ncbi:MAG TPA: PspC domain-containing protein [Candidatus Wallbacteria bacterium]|nr:MAG: PspC domain protein [bacterium ADurb.Bin243]HOD41303.1 PspC domain-containing protein [Candidatus Wallbacteria bacterium]HPG57769.1 PspC domain-containing protein [Candidatus Wallbacteria bacterium]
MRNLMDYYTFTNEARKALENFYESIKREGKNYPAEDIAELLESLNEHIEIAIKEKLKYSGAQRVDAQMVLETLYSLGDPAEIVSELGVSSEERAEKITEKITIKYKYIPIQKTLCRSSRDRWFFGVCGGFAEYFGVSSLLMRLLFIFSGVGILFYILLALLIPDEAQAKAGGRSAGVDLIVSSVRGLFLLFMCIIYIPVLFGFAVASLVSFNTLIGVNAFFKAPFTTYIFGTTSSFLLGFFGLILSVSVLALLINFIMQAHFGGGFLKIGSRNVYAFAIVASIIGISMVFGQFNRYTRYSGESIEHFEFKSPSQSLNMVFNEKDTGAPIFDKSIEIAGAEDGGDTIQVDVLKTAYGPNEDAAREHAKDMDVKIEMLPGDKMSFLVSSKDAGRSYYTFPKMKMKIRVPSRIACRVEADNIEKDWHSQLHWMNIRGENDLTVSKRNATTEIEVKNTNVSVEDIDSGKFSLTGASGNLAANNVKSSEFAVEVTNGNINAEKIESNNCTIKSTTGNIKTSVIKSDVIKCESNVGNVSLYKASINRESVINSNIGNVKVNFEALKNKSTHRISSDVGNVTLTIPESASPKVVAKSSIGNTSNAFDDEKFTDESPVVTVSTNVGNIKIKKD